MCNQNRGISNVLTIAGFLVIVFGYYKFGKQPPIAIGTLMILSWIMIVIKISSWACSLSDPAIERELDAYFTYIRAKYGTNDTKDQTKVQNKIDVQKCNMIKPKTNPIEAPKEVTVASSPTDVFILSKKEKEQILERAGNKYFN